MWFDAVIGYLSASIEWARRLGEPDRWREWWNDPEALSYYFMGKDNITFHSQIWPAELLAYDGRGDRGGEPRRSTGELNLPDRGGVLGVPDHGGPEVLLLQVGRDLRPRRARALPGRRVPLLRRAAGPENQDADFTWAEFVRRTNDELVAGWGNLVNRTANMIAKSFGEIPAAGS